MLFKVCTLGLLHYKLAVCFHQEGKTPPNRKKIIPRLKPKGEFLKLHCVKKGQTCRISVELKGGQVKPGQSAYQCVSSSGGQASPSNAGCSRSAPLEPVDWELWPPV